MDSCLLLFKRNTYSLLQTWKATWWAHDTVPYIPFLGIQNMFRITRKLIVYINE